MEQAVNIWRWTGGAPLQAWGKLARDPELWDPEGDALVYFGRRYPDAAFRIPSSLLTNTGSQVLQLLLDTHRQPDKSGNPIVSHPTPPLPYIARDSSSEGSSNYSARADFEMNRSSKRDGSTLSVSNISLSTTMDDPSVLYRIYMPPPTGISKAAAIRYHLTTRNVFALLLRKCLVGTDFYIALKDLQTRLEAYMPPQTNCVKLIERYLISRRLHNVSNNPSMAAGLLAWCELSTVRWKEGWREAFVHCCGMFSRLGGWPEHKHISATSHALLQKAHDELLSRMRDAEERLLTFSFDDTWASSRTGMHPARAGFNSFRKFLRSYHEKEYKAWKQIVAQEHCNESWLTRELARQLQSDHGALYDYLVDRQAVWEGNERIVDKAKKPLSGPDAEDQLVAVVLAAFDHRHGNTSILHPYPLLPASVPVDAAEGGLGDSGQRKKFGLFSSRASRAREKRMHQAYADANNSGLLKKATLKNPLVDAFRRFEKTDQIAQMDPRDARKGRWILLYCTLQVLADISVDTPGLFFTDVPYFLNPRLTNTPPWAPQDKQASGKTLVGVFDEASRFYSHCWIVPKTWGFSDTVTNTAATKPHDATAPRDDVTNRANEDGRDVARRAPDSPHRPRASADKAGVSNTNAVPPLDAQAPEDEPIDLEDAGDPGFRAPLAKRARSGSQHISPNRDGSVHRKLGRPASSPRLRRMSFSFASPPDVDAADVGVSNYRPPAEW